MKLIAKNIGKLEDYGNKSENLQRKLLAVGLEHNYSALSDNLSLHVGTKRLLRMSTASLSASCLPLILEGQLAINVGLVVCR